MLTINLSIVSILPIMPKIVTAYKLPKIYVMCNMSSLNIFTNTNRKKIYDSENLIETIGLLRLLRQTFMNRPRMPSNTL